MRFTKIAGVVFLVLVLLVGVSAAQDRVKPRTFTFSLGGGYHMSNLAVDYEKSWIYYDEYATFIEVLDKVSSVSFGGTLGYFVTPNIEVFAGGFLTRTSSQNGLFGFEVPSIYYYNELAYDELAEARCFSQTDLMFGVKYHFAPMAKFDFYLGAGGVYSMAKIELTSDFWYYDYYDEYYYHSIEVFDPVYTETKASAFGGFAVGGVEYAVGPMISIFAEGAYKFAKKSVVHPFSEWFEDTDEISLDLGGIALMGGLKFNF